MTTLNHAGISELSDNELLANIKDAARNERVATAQLIALLMEMDMRRLYLSEGFSSLFTYCTRALRLAEHAAYNRIEAARAARRFPLVLQMLEDGAVTLATVRLLAPHLTPENHRDVLTKARHKTKRDVEELVAALAPRPEQAPSIRRLPTPQPISLTAVEPQPETVTGATLAADLAAPARPLPVGKVQSAEVKPVAPERYKIQFSVNRSTYEKLRRVQDLLRHVVPTGDPAVIFDRALTLLLADLERTKIGSVKRPRTMVSATAHRPGTTRNIPAAVRRAVWQRDGGRCAFTSAKGHRCEETGFLEFHHVVPFVSGGQTSVSNLQLRCRSHNQYEADRHFGRSDSLLLREQRAAYAGDGRSPRGESRVW